MRLSDTAIRNAKPREKPYKIFDGGGLHVLVSPSGSRLWRLKYRFGGREKLLSFGPYPLIGLRDAREKRDAALRFLLESRDASEERKAERHRREQELATTFGGIAEEYLEKAEREERAPATMKKLRWLVSLTRPRLYDTPMRRVEPPDVLAVLQAVEAGGTYETARRLRATIGAVSRYAIATGRASHDPTEALKGALTRPNVKPRSAIIDPGGLGDFLGAIDRMDAQPTTRIALQLLGILAPRPGELRRASWTEFDLDAAVWRVPAERMKMRRPHRVPLPRQAIERLEELRRLTGDGELLFPSVRSRLVPMSENTLNTALRRMGYSSEQMSAHGFRAIFSTFANESGLWHPDAIERALAHVETNDVRRAYLRGEHWEERTRLAQWWGDQLDELKEGRNRTTAER